MGRRHRFTSFRRVRRLTSSSNIHSKQGRDTTLDAGRDARARAWRFVLDTYERKKKAGAPHAGDEEKGPKRDLPAQGSVPE